MWKRILAMFRRPEAEVSKFAQPQDEPLFVAVRNDDSAMLNAYEQAAESIDQFLNAVRAPGERVCSAKLRFRDPDESERLGEDRFLFLWLTAVSYHDEPRVLSAVFFEVPEPFNRWHQVGQRIAFGQDEIFDWMVLEHGRLQGGFTLRVAREHLPPEDRASYDRYIGVSSYESLPAGEHR